MKKGHIRWVALLVAGMLAYGSCCNAETISVLDTKEPKPGEEAVVILVAVGLVVFVGYLIYRAVADDVAYQKSRHASASLKRTLLLSQSQDSLSEIQMSGLNPIVDISNNGDIDDSKTVVGVGWTKVF